MSKDDIKLQIFENKLKQDLEKRTALVIQQTIKKLKRDENDYKDARVYKWRSMSFNFTTNNFQYSPAANFFGQKTQTHKILHKRRKQGEAENGQGQRHQLRQQTWILRAQEQMVINLSKNTLAPDCVSVLSKGLSFSPTYHNEFNTKVDLFR